jgi:hypothetical protein
MEIMTIHSWKSQYISVCFFGYDLLCDIGALLQLAET